MHYLGIKNRPFGRCIKRLNLFVKAVRAGAGQYVKYEQDDRTQERQQNQEQPPGRKARIM